MRGKPRPGRLGLGPGPEFDLIRGFHEDSRSTEAPGVLVGPGDDCAVVAGDGIALSTDMSVEGIHFDRDWIRPVEIGYRATMAALSDLAAVAARPIGALVSLGLPIGEPPSSATEIMLGVRRALAEIGGSLLGGDVVATPGPIVIDVCVVGEAPRPVARSGARPGDELWVTGELGGAGSAVLKWRAGKTPPDSLRARFAAPRARIEAALWLAERGAVHAMIDLSDGLAGDAAHLSAASEVRIELEAAAIPVHPAVREVAGSEAEALRLALTGGEDFEICFAAPPGAVEPIREEFASIFDLPITRVGRAMPGQGVTIRDAHGASVLLDLHGYQHFEAPA